MRGKSARLLFVSIDVDEVTFNRGYYSVDVRYYYHVRGEALTILNKPQEINGLCVFDKRVILFGSEGSAKIFTSRTVLGGPDSRTLEYSNLPTAVVEAVDPIVLGLRVVDTCDNNCGDKPGPFGIQFGFGEIPDQIQDSFGSDLLIEPGNRQLFVTLGQFSIIRLERDTQLLIPSYDYYVPSKECLGGSEDDACTMFSKIRFPVDEFFPPDVLDAPEGYREAKSIIS